jgi:hypothetical protein
MCTELVEQEGVLLLQSSIYRSERGDTASATGFYDNQQMRAPSAIAPDPRSARW